MPARHILQDVFDAVPNGVLAVDRSGRIAAINREALEILNLVEEAVLHQPADHVAPHLAAVINEFLSCGRPQRGLQVREAGGGLMVDVSSLDVKDHTAGVVCSFVRTRDFESSARTLKLYEDLNTQLNAIIDLSSDGIWVSTGEGLVLRINNASAKLNGLKADDVVGTHIQSVVDRGLIDTSATLKVLETKKQVNMLQYVSRTKKHLLLTGTPLFDENGEVSLVVVNERDLTQLNATREQLEQQRQVSQKYMETLTELSMQELKDERIVAESHQMQAVLRTALKLAHMDLSNILLLGESGTGKGLLAKYIHNKSPRREKPFIQINCAALPETLLEAELFGYEKGAFTGAGEKGKAGLFELAQGGTLFLDEIGEAPPSAQAKILKYLDDHEVLRLGGTRPTTIDCSIIAATNQDLEARVRAGAFRKDLLYRLNTFTLQIVPLRERSDDIFELADYFTRTYCKRYGVERRISPNAMARLQGHAFPGNVRELKSIIKKAVVMSERELLDGDFIESLAEYEERSSAAGGMDSTRLSDEVGRVEKRLLRQAMGVCRSTREMASYLGVSQPTVVRKLRRHGLTPSSMH
jgi:PAS domain S-box-containing protein